MKVLTIIAIIIISIIAIVMVSNIITLIGNLAEYLKVKSGLLSVDLKRKKETGMDSLHERILTTNDLLHMINGLINLDIAKRVEVLRMMSQPYNILNLDNDIKIIATTVFKAVKEEIYNHPTLMLNADYLFEYISTQTSVQLTSAMKEFNLTLYIPQTNDDHE